MYVKRVWAAWDERFQTQVVLSCSLLINACILPHLKNDVGIYITSLYVIPETCKNYAKDGDIVGYSTYLKCRYSHVINFRGPFLASSSSSYLFIYLSFDEKVRGPFQ